MKLNKFEFFLINHPIRGLLQDKMEAKEFKKFSNSESFKKVLEIGCGNGTGTKLIKKYFSPNKIFAIDLDEKMISLAKRNNSDINIFFEIGDATVLKYNSNQFDAIFDFWIIHHIPNWKQCLKELKRVLKPGGQLFIDDLSIESFNLTTGKLWRKSLDHPYKNMYTREEFINYLKNLGFRLINLKICHPGHLLKYFILVAMLKNNN